ncbi:MAG TPA: serine/threonine-protein kinase, partial [Planctomycetota bacterium]|nr:serine/threonine-protein kinase [Planctomycetota bacterium]
MANANGNGHLPSGGEAREIEASRALGEFLDRAATGSSPNLLEFLTEHPHLASELAGPLHTFEELASIIEGRSPAGSFGDFRILREVGQGGMGIVYEAWQVSLNRRVALKVLPREKLGDPQALARFHREAKLVASLEHANIVRIHVTGIEDGVPYFAMEYVEGETLRQMQKRLQSTGRGISTQAMTDRGIRAIAAREVVSASPGCERLESDSWEADWLECSGSLEAAPGAGSSTTLLDLSPRLMAQLAEAFAEAADGLQHAHTRGIVHRDIKPSNLLLDSSGHLRILDFGLAFMEGDPRLTHSEERIGTPLYMSPEQARGDSHALDRGTDIYSLGATLYEILAGRPPFQGGSCQETLQQIIHREPQAVRRVNPRIAGDLETIVMKCLQTDPRERYATAEALAQDLRRFVRGEPIEARPQSACAVLARRAWRSRRRIAEAASGLLLLAALGLLLVHQIRESRHRKETRYVAEVRVASATFNQKPVLLAASSIRELDGEKVLLPLKPGETVLSTRREGGYHGIFEVGRDVVEAGAAFVGAAPDP